MPKAKLFVSGILSCALAAGSLVARTPVQAKTSPVEGTASQEKLTVRTEKKSKSTVSVQEVLNTVYYDIPLDRDLQAYIEQLCSEYNFPFHKVVFGLIYTESGFDPNCYSATHDIGLCQINESNYGWLSQELGITDLFDPYQNVRAGIHILAENYHQTGDIAMALMAYQYGMQGAQSLWAQGVYSSAHSEKSIGFANSLQPISYENAPSGEYHDSPALSVDQQRAVEFVSQNGLMTGTDGNFNPYQNVTRAQLATILYRLQKPAGNYIYPADVPAGEWYSNAAAWACSIGLMGQGSLFNANNILSRQDLAVVLYRFEKYSSKPVNVLSNYQDHEQISDYAVDALNWMVNQKIMGAGTSNLNPQGALSRIDLALILLRWLS